MTGIDRLQRIEDWIALYQLSTQYCQAIDTHDQALFRGVWTPTAVWRFDPPRGTFTGIDAILDGYRRLIGEVPTSHHTITGPGILTYHDESHISAQSDCLAQSGTPAGLSPIMFAQYHDSFIRLNGQWKIHERNVTIHRN